MRLGSYSEPNSLQDNCHSTEILCLRFRVPIILVAVAPTKPFWITSIFTMSPPLMLNASKNTTKPKSNMWNAYDKSLKTSSSNWDLTLSLDVRE